jgi:hypothetical protein
VSYLPYKLSKVEVPTWSLSDNDQKTSQVAPPPSEGGCGGLVIGSFIIVPLGGTQDATYTPAGDDYAPVQRHDHEADVVDVTPDVSALHPSIFAVSLP